MVQPKMNGLYINLIFMNYFFTLTLLFVRNVKEDNYAPHCDLPLQALHCSHQELNFQTTVCAWVCLLSVRLPVPKISIRHA